MRLFPPRLIFCDMRPLDDLDRDANHGWIGIVAAIAAAILRRAAMSEPELMK